ncbi:chemotaxis protein CheB [Stigmatella aurantiaca]|uniref:protein-glutamate methylesterase n=1 Tax=Stigmatella aurantiaca (strain DW4/3-1) TaxID=378806 RepID=Q08QC2_STIAD|nr:chemotaxis protein CheB [Stigmatella aurantiaca]ADO71594.1 Chemotaxis response regulator protein-glutamate methylesterase [Stigmatella aurantiaca DW4/3-1]EAU62686.1 chemotaxis response regulator protein-glutamate methylesterase group 3operon [Stigmatella aurantiaca DW4/3-1]
MSKPIQVLLTDDSPTMLQVLTRLLSAQPDVSVVGTARDGEEAVALSRSLKPDVITLDVQMPGMDGLGATERIMSESPCRILMVSGAPDTDLSFRALQAGALEVIAKPQGAPEDVARFGVRLLSAIRLLAEVPLVTQRHEGRSTAPALPPGSRVAGFGLTASIGGPTALASLLWLLPRSLPFPLFIAQHITPGFTVGLHRWLSSLSPLPVEIARATEQPRAGTVYLPPDGHHLRVGPQGELVVERASGSTFPSGDLLLASMARAYGVHAAGAVLSGMGEEGAVGLMAIRRAGGLTFAQEPETCLVAGMPEAALRNKATEQVVSPETLATVLRALEGVQLVPSTPGM